MIHFCDIICCGFYNRCGGNILASEKLSKVKKGVDYVKTYWNKPPKGKYVSFREYVDIGVA